MFIRIGKNSNKIGSKTLSQKTHFKGFYEPENGFNELFDSQEWNHSLVVTPLANARGAPQL